MLNSDTDRLKKWPLDIDEMPVSVAEKCSNIISFAQFQGLVPFSSFATFLISSSKV